ncbi:unnamed protein product [Paramecium pentaurelia]|uniref:Uncharacterized protein n=1 Tax=Paramecium pentaurelia TaxID=43138 RepID=A0A8S1YKW5_9CILI|nr:unnamed protein product [Paramecium pentaurelia]
MMTLVNLNKLVETPFMMEIIVQVLPNIILKATEIINIKQTFLKNFQKIFKEFLISKYRIQMYKSQQKRHFEQSINEINKESETEIQVDQDEFLEVTQNDLYILEENSIPQSMQNSQESEGMQTYLQTIFETKLLLPNQICMIYQNTQLDLQKQ